jgi:hypothetical protein
MSQMHFQCIILMHENVQITNEQILHNFYY